MHSLVNDAGLSADIEIDSAGTGGWHVGSPPDKRASAAASARGVALESRARQLRDQDFYDFDLLLAMDSSNLSDLQRAAPGEQQREKVRLLREFDPASAGQADLDVPDPYYGGVSGFDDVFDMVHAACEGLLAKITAEVAR